MSGMDKDSPAGEGAGAPNPTSKMARRRARELALQGVYQWLLSGNAMTTVQRHLEAESENLDKTDRELFVSLLRGAIGSADELRGCFEPLLSRPIAELSPIEHAILLLGTHELRHNIETPYRVVINEAIELAKGYGGTDGHKFVNGVLDKTAARLRPEEVAAARASRG
ncbi:transcription antitermination factor NusB [Thauera linaloolentis]|uniref:Transcription antitermination protein NusB n=1 Tax=Thauera linaloolentis (strain DSM 12138 / JCM 21573 / CCUG 41526 / CIP 105981 / IAM 15112 / NBRC 102519 / 47Lol) TaxID=1123367 RepID=N6XWI8_THAL4|nr:transcription antitermination factor NusB [Thauera linaloolentis]ENO86146.1 transcription antitermination protein NusB [Thauera linaloolentis 47Lol = DSM 12138]MCM8564625.1 transcription antitermination factor NusB [Thauera linaloolentis]